MKPTMLMMTALVFMIALVLPAGANIVYSGTMPDHAPMFESKYADPNPTPNWPTESYGYAVFRLRAGIARDPFVFITREGSNVKLDPTFHMDGTPVTGTNPEMMSLFVMPDGISPPVLMASGTYIAYIRNGHADQVESKVFKIGGGQISYVDMLGQAMPTSSGSVLLTAEVPEEPEPDPEPIDCMAIICDR